MGGGLRKEYVTNLNISYSILVGNTRRDMLPLISEYAKVEGGGGGDYARNAGADSRTPVFLHMLYMHQIVYACIDLEIFTASFFPIGSRHIFSGFYLKYGSKNSYYEDDVSALDVEYGINIKTS